jgi:hypothetical protein
MIRGKSYSAIVEGGLSTGVQVGFGGMTSLESGAGFVGNVIVSLRGCEGTSAFRDGLESVLGEATSSVSNIVLGR